MGGLIGKVLLSPGKRLALSGLGYAPGTRVMVDVFSDPIRLGSVVADADGNFLVEAVVPDQLPSGAHALRIMGTNADGGILEITHGVLMEPVDDEPVTADPLATQLPATGAARSGLVWWSVCALVVGLTLLRRSRSARLDGRRCAGTGQSSEYSA